MGAHQHISIIHILIIDISFDDEWHTLSHSEHASRSVSAAKAHICSTQFTLDIHFKPMVTSEN